ncbi:asparaginase-domain-containing protein [Spinellus fusiger]|nr:asparaginase-domain-containing protein [Spinellus fusiger]
MLLHVPGIHNSPIVPVESILDVSRILIIYTGGTIGMKLTPHHGYIPHPNYFTRSLVSQPRFHDPDYNQGSTDFSCSPPIDRIDDMTLKEEEAIPYFTKTNPVRTIVHQGPLQGQERVVHLPSLITPLSLYGKRTRYSILEYDPLLDSCNMTMSDWVRIARDIQVNYQSYDAFIVLHGTDTMAYTASALSFMLEALGKTVIVTGSQVPLTELRNDAVENLLGAITIAGHFVIPEVCLYFSQKLYRGNRTSKKSAVDFDAFDSPNIPPLVEVGIDIEVKWANVLRPTQIAKFQAHQELNPNVGTLRLFPGISATTIRASLASPLEGVVLETFGAGNAPARPELIAALKEATDRGGLVSDVYATGKQLAQIGVVAGADMTPECALTKLSYLLGKYPNNPNKIRILMTKSLCGELTVRAQQTQFRPVNSNAKLLTTTFLKLSLQNNPIYPSLDISENTNTTEEEQLMAEKSFASIMMCFAAFKNDIETMQLMYSIMMEDFNWNCVDYEGRSPIHLASKSGHLRIVEYLLHHGASLHVRDHSGRTPLHYALVEKHVEVASMLREAGAHLAESELNAFGVVWLNAVKDNDLKLVKLALESGWKINWKEPVEGRRAIDVAVSEGQLPVLHILLGYSELDLQTRDFWGFSAIDKLQMLRTLKQKDTIGKYSKISESTIDAMEVLLAQKLKSIQ